MAPEIAGLIWEGDVSDDAYQRALQNPMDQQSFLALRDAANKGQIPKEQMPRVVQQLIATDSVDKAMQLAQEQGISPEQALGQIAQQRAAGEFDESDLQTAFDTMATEEAYKAVQERLQAGDPTANDPNAVDQAKEGIKKQPGFLDKMLLMWKSLPMDQKIGMVVGITSSVIALVNGISGGSGTTTLIAGALGLAGIGYGLGGSYIKDWMGFGDKTVAKATPEAAPEAAAPEGVLTNPPPGAPDFSDFAPVAGPDAEAEAAVNPDAAMEEAAGPAGPAPFPEPVVQALKDDVIDMPELKGMYEDNPEMIRGMEDAQLAELLPKLDPQLQSIIDHFAQKPELLEDETVQKFLAKRGIKASDITRLIQIRNLAAQPAA